MNGSSSYNLEVKMDYDCHRMMGCLRLYPFGGCFAASQAANYGTLAQYKCIVLYLPRKLHFLVKRFNKLLDDAY